MLNLTSRIILKCIQELTKDGEVPDGLGRLALAGMISYREGDSDLSDPAWLDLVVTENSESVAFQIGVEAPEGPLQEAIEAYVSENSSPASLELRRGAQEYLLRSVSLQGRGQRRDPGEGGRSREIIQMCSQRICLEILKDIPVSLERKDLLVKLNIVILVEEACLDVSGYQPPSKERRKLSLDYAVTRLLSTLSLLDNATLEDFENAFRAIGNMSRLNNGISDSLDRVQSYAAKAAKDKDIAEAGAAAGRPYVGSYGDIRTAARQCRKFRDLEKI